MGHTPGPWMVADRFYILMDDDVACEVAKVCEENIDDDCLEQCDADARLIAAAPEMLGFLHQIAEECKRRLLKGEDSGDRLTLQLCKAAISKAEGRSE